MSEETAGESQLFENVSRSFTEAVRRAMRVATQSEEGELPVHAVAQSDLEDGDVAHTGAGHVVIPQVQL